MKQQTWEVRFNYRCSGVSYSRNGEVTVFADTFEEAAETLKAKLPELYADESIHDIRVLEVQHRGEKTIVVSDRCMENWRSFAGVSDVQI